MKTKILVLTAIGFLMITSVKAQRVISLADALDYALNNHETIKQARLDIENGKHTIDETMAAARPQLNGVSNLVANPLVMQFVFPAAVVGGSPDEFMTIKAGQVWNGMTAVQLNQQLYNQQLFTGLKAAKTSIELYQLLKDMSEENVIQQVAANYYQVVVNQHKLGLIDSNLDRLQKLKDILQGLLDNGMARKIDVDRIRVNQANLKTQKSQLLNAIDLQLNVLKYSMGMRVAEKISLADEDISRIALDAATLSVQPDLDTDAIIGIRVLKKQNELLHLNEEVKKGEFYPNLGLSGQFVINSQSDKLNVYSGKALTYKMANVTLGLNIPIYGGGARKARLEKARVDILKNEQDFSSTQKALNMMYSNARLMLENSLETIQSQKENLSLAEEVYENTQNNYKLGLVNLTDLLNAESELTNTQNAYTDALLQFKVSQIELIKAKGEIRTLLK